MNKVKLGNKPMLYPYPVVMLGANVEGKANFMALGFVGITNINPGMIAMGVAKNHFTTLGIQENKTFSINLPSEDMLKVTDYVGIVSGQKEDKSKLFNVFYGETQTAPMIEECPLNMECKVLEILDLGGVDYIIIGEIIENYARESVLTDGNPDVEKMNPMVFSMFDNRYFGIGDYLGKGWSVGREFEAK